MRKWMRGKREEERERMLSIEIVLNELACESLIFYAVKLILVLVVRVARLWLWFACWFFSRKFVSFLADIYLNAAHANHGRRRWRRRFAHAVAIVVTFYHHVHIRSCARFRLLGHAGRRLCCWVGWLLQTNGTVHGCEWNVISIQRSTARRRRGRQRHVHRSTCRRFVSFVTLNLHQQERCGTALRSTPMVVCGVRWGWGWRRCRHRWRHVRVARRWVMHILRT